MAITKVAARTFIAVGFFGGGGSLGKDLMISGRPILTQSQERKIKIC